MANLSNIDQAQHNQKTCEFLHNDGKFSDWVVTTAFYSAIHYIRHYVLPFDDQNGAEYKTFERLYEDKKSENEGRHGFQLNLVKNECAEIAFYYQKLHEMSTNARYKNYNYTKKEATIAKNYLFNIIDFVNKKINSVI